VNKNPLLSQL